MIKQKIAHVGLAVLGLAASVGFLTTNEASAKGCNGVVSQLEWGCAAWDNNNGPQFPHYKKPATTHAPAARIAPAAAPTQAQRPAIAPNSGNRLIGNDGAGLVAAGAGNVQSKSGVVAAGGGN